LSQGYQLQFRLMFLAYINDVNENITSSVCLFTDNNCVIYETITTPQDSNEQWDDLNEWSKLQQMKINADKCTCAICYDVLVP